MTNHSENIRLQHKLCEARVFNKLKFNTNSPSEQAKRLVASSIPLSKRKELYREAMGSSSPDCSSISEQNSYVNPRTNLEASPAPNIINDTLILPTGSFNHSIIAIEPIATVTSPMVTRIRQLEIHMNIKHYTIENVPGDGSCFFHALLIEFGNALRTKI